MEHIKRFIAQTVALGAITLTAHLVATAQEPRVCDLGEALQQPERLEEFVDCSVFTVKVLNRPVACGLYDKLSRRMKSGWVSAVRTTCRESKSCVELMAECAARPIAGTDIQGISSSSAQSQGSSTSPVSSSSSSSRETSQSSSSALGSSAGGVPTRSSSSSWDGSSQSSSAATDRAPVIRGSRPQPVMERRPRPIAPRKAVVLPTGESSRAQAEGSDCYVCIYDLTDPDTHSECDYRAKRAREQGVKQVKTFPHTGELQRLQRHLCDCRNIDILQAAHGYPGQEGLPFEEISNILDVVPQCSINFHDWRCSGFDNHEAAVAEAKKLSTWMAQNGYAGKIVVNGFQTVNISPLAFKDDDRLRAIADMPTSVTEKVTLRKLRMKIEYNLSQVTRDAFCQHINTPIQFQVCAEGVSLALAPCKEAGSVSIVDKAHAADRTNLCEKNGKQAFQSCSYIELPQVPDINLPPGRTLRGEFSRAGYKDDGCHVDGTCICQWREAVACP